MTDFSERRFSIDPGKGKKMDGCPYSIYEDGRDVKDYIIPPKGYVFKGFRFDPEASNQIYDGKLIAIYEKESFNQKMMSQLWKFILAFAIIAVIAIIAILAAGVFKDPSPKPNRPVKESTTTDQSQEPESIAVIDSSAAETETVDTLSVEQALPIENEPKVTEVQEKETAQLITEDPSLQFKQAFWTLIHQRTIMMDAYDTLFKENKGKVEGEEYDYLRYTILKNSTAFKEWTSRLQKIPASDLETINTINDLKSKLNSINNNN